MNKKKGSILLSVYMVLVILLILSGVFVSRSMNERKLFDINRERMEAFYLAESAVDRGIVELNNNYSYAGTSAPVALGRGEYEIVVTTISATRKRIMAYGYVPDKANKRVERQIEAVTKKEIPPDFYDNAIYSGGEVEMNGNSFAVNGQVVYADDLDTQHPENINDGGNPAYPAQDSTISPLAHFDFETLREIAVTQGNLYDTARLSQVQNHSDSFPLGFWYIAPDPNAASGTTEYFGTPNVVYVEGDMVVSGNFGTVGGFFLVVGNVLTDPDAAPDSTINGNGEVDGCIYALGEFRINGGGGGLNVDGGVWAGEEAYMGGNSTLTYNADFMNAIENLVDTSGGGSSVQLLSWRELK